MFAHIIIQICTIMMYDCIIPVDYRLLPAEPEPVEAAALYLDPQKSLWFFQPAAVTCLQQLASVLCLALHMQTAICTTYNTHTHRHTTLPQGSVL